MAERRKVLPYDPALRPLARQLRKQGTLGEVLLWRQLQRRQRAGHTFYRQRPIDRFIVDFFSPELALVIEVDGSSHDETRVVSDANRERRLRELGLEVLRFTETEVRRNLEGVVEAIDLWISDCGS